MEGGLLEVRVSKKTDGDLQSFHESGGKSDHVDGKSTTGFVYHPKFSPIRRLDHKISAIQVGAFLAVDLMV